MKTIKYHGKQYEVEDWVNFVAMDADGDIYGYEHEPHIHLSDQWVRATGKVESIGIESTEWDNSLEKV